MTVEEHLSTFKEVGFIGAREIRPAADLSLRAAEKPREQVESKGVPDNLSPSLGSQQERGMELTSAESEILYFTDKYACQKNRQEPHHAAEVDRRSTAEDGLFRD